MLGAGVRSGLCTLVAYMGICEPLKPRGKAQLWFPERMDPNTGFLGTRLSVGQAGRRHDWTLHSSHLGVAGGSPLDIHNTQVETLQRQPSSLVGRRLSLPGATEQGQTGLACCGQTAKVGQHSNPPSSSMMLNHEEGRPACPRPILSSSGWPLGGRQGTHGRGQRK